MRYNTYLYLVSSKGEFYADSFLKDCTHFSDSSKNLRDVESYYTKKSLFEIRKNIPEYGLFHLKGMFNFFLDPGRYDIAQYIYGENREASGLLRKFSEGGYVNTLKALFKENGLLLSAYIAIILFNALILLIYILFLFFHKKRIEVFLSLSFVFILALATGPIGASRFKMPIFPIMLFSVISFLTEKYKISGFCKR